ncbi:hypothetical protein E4L96_04545 [Massilia arenosa]|uniref:Uncharacterized protein n=1 Tax=Zemynaea arenosa TaxID=2561931 RepID=A0A4Y9SJU7_9BURK|nr:hypothetical protein [Massilia arenosa]TFW26276.1 hypothetical protein E4L96_04545 [Massilia arenosa]
MNVKVKPVRKSVSLDRCNAEPRADFSRFDSVFVSAVGGGALGSVFGVPGLLAGLALGSWIGFVTAKSP